MNRSFNLIDEPWLPVRLQDGRVCDLGLLEVFERAGEISALAETAPPSLIAQYRLLLVIVHRALSRAQGRWTDADRARWYRQGLPVEVVRDYLEHWRERFWLFHPEQPFMQVAALAEAEETRDKQKPWSQISLASANGNTPVVFDHSCDQAPRPIVAADALRHLLGYLQFAPPGTIQVFRYSDNACALTDSAAVMPLGTSLAQSLCLALHPSSPNGHADLPSWERSLPSIDQLTGAPLAASGPNDSYTRQARAVLLLPDEQGRVQWIRFGAGIALDKDAEAPDPMISYRVNDKGLLRLKFSEGRAFWRDLSSLLPDPGGQMALAAPVLAWSANLCMFSGGHQQSLLVAGLSSAPGKLAKLERWRLERFNLPAALLASVDCANEVRHLLHQAESIFTAIKQLAIEVYVEILPQIRREDRWAKAREMFNRSSATAGFFAAAERSLGAMLQRLAEGDPDGAVVVWKKALLTAAESAWREVRVNISLSPRALRAEARAYPRLLRLLAPLRSTSQPFVETATEAHV